eukprot:5875337-Alexandrium_andersonii.AAC.1
MAVPVVQAVMRQLLVSIGIALPPTPWSAGSAQESIRTAASEVGCEAIDAHWRQAGMNVDGPGPSAPAAPGAPQAEMGEFGTEDPIEDFQVAQLAGALPQPLATFLPGGPPAGSAATPAPAEPTGAEPTLAEELSSGEVGGFLPGCLRAGSAAAGRSAPASSRSTG